jgi:hypothetical protein
VDLSDSRVDDSVPHNTLLYLLPISFICTVKFYLYHLHHFPGYEFDDVNYSDKAVENSNVGSSYVLESSMMENVGRPDKVLLFIMFHL